MRQGGFAASDTAFDVVEFTVAFAWPPVTATLQRKPKKKYQNFGKIWIAIYTNDYLIRRHLAFICGDVSKPSGCSWSAYDLPWSLVAGLRVDQYLAIGKS
jgi:hypothetical protein